MKPLLLLALLLLAGAGPATRPTTRATDLPERFVVQVRRVEYTLKPGEAAPIVPGDRGAKLPANAIERSSLQVTAAVGSAFEAVATVNGTTYRLGGKLTRVASDADRVAVQVDYRESTGESAVSLSQITSGVVATVDVPIQLGGLTGEAGGHAIMLSVSRGRSDGAPPPPPRAVSSSARP